MNYTLPGILASDVAVAGTFTAAYPSATTQPGQSVGVGGISNQSSKSDFLNSFGHTLIMNGTSLSIPDQASISLGTATTSTPGNITITNRTSATWKAGSPYNLNLVDAKQNQFITSAGISVPHTVKLGGGRFFINFGNPVAKSTTALLATVAVTDASNQLASAGTYDLVATGVCPQGRGLQYVSSSASDSAITVVATGVDIYGKTMTEKVTLNGTTPVLGLKAFSKVSAINASGTMVGTLSVGTTDLLGSPMFLPAAGAGFITELLDGIVPTAGTLLAGVQVSGNSLNTSGDVRGTWLPNTATNGSHCYALIISSLNEDYLGQPQSIV